MKEKQKKQQKNKQRQKRARKGGAEAIVKGSELNDFVVHLS